VVKKQTSASLNHSNTAHAGSPFLFPELCEHRYVLRRLRAFTAQFEELRLLGKGSRLSGDAASAQLLKAKKLVHSGLAVMKQRCQASFQSFFFDAVRAAGAAYLQYASWLMLFREFVEYLDTIGGLVRGSFL